MQGVGNVLEVNGLTTAFRIDGEYVNAVEDVCFEIPKGKSLALVGESGSGKSVTSLSIMRLIQTPPGKIMSGTVKISGKDILTLSEGQMRKVRGNRLGMIFQEPMTSLNPVFTIGNQISEVFRIHQGMSKSEALKESIKMLELVKIPAPEQRVHEYPHQLSGGMRQRVMIAMALACKPEVLIADEPTTALDVTIQAQVLDIISDLQEKLEMSVLLITHDLGVVAEVCDEVAVMYAGRIVERGSVRDIFKRPRHPYTKGLIASIPKLGQKVNRLPTIEGTVPSLNDLPKGCRFNNRCAYVTERCTKEKPELRSLWDGQQVACWNAESVLTNEEN